MLELPITLNSDEFERAAARSKQSLQGLGDVAISGASKFTTLEGRMNKAFQVTGGSVQVAQGIQQTAKALGEMNIAAAGFGASRSLLELGRLKDDFRDFSSTVTTVTTDLYGVTTSVTKNGSAWTTLGALIKAHPLLTIATVLGTVASVMTLVSNNTSKASAQWDNLAESISKARKEQELAKSLGESPLSGLQAERSGLRSSIDTVTTPATVGEFAKQQGVGVNDVLRYLASQGNTEALAILRGGETQRMTQPSSSSYEEPQPIQPYDWDLTAMDQNRMIRAQYENMKRRVEEEQARSTLVTANDFNTNSLYSYRPPLDEDKQADVEPYSGMGPYLPGTHENVMTRMGADQWKADKMLEKTQEIAALSQQIGNYLGDAAFRFLNGMATARQLMTGLVMDAARMGLTQGATALTKSFFSSFGLNPTQAKTGTT